MRIIESKSGGPCNDEPPPNPENGSLNERWWYSVNKRRQINIELFAAPACNRCRDAKQALNEIAEEIGGGRIEWREVNVLEELDYAVALGVLSPMAIAIDERLAFATLPSVEKFRKALKARLEEMRA